MPNPTSTMPRLSEQQRAVLIEALEAVRQCGNKANWYHRGQYGFGINQRTASALERMGLVDQRVWDRFYRPTQYVQLTPKGYSVATELMKTASAES